MALFIEVFRKISSTWSGKMAFVAPNCPDHLDYFFL